MKLNSRASISIGIWLVTTVSLALWWLIHGLHQVRRIGEINPELSTEVLRGQRMLYGEGAFFLILLVIGGIALFYYNLREEKRHRQTEEFFAILTHELKTPLASLRLQVESIQEDLMATGPAKLLERLYQDSVRLELQL